MKQKVLIAGGGFAGSSLARRLGQRAEVTIISSDNFMLFTPMLAEAAVGDVDPRHIVAPLRQLAPHAQIIQGEISSIDGARRQVTVKSLLADAPIEIQGDVLVLALGSVPNTFGVPGAEDNVLGFKTITDALRIRNRMLALLESASQSSNPYATTIAVIGAGYSGVELAAALADFLRSAHRRFFRHGPAPEVVLIDAVDRVTPGLSPDLSAKAAAALQRRGVRLVLGSPVAEVAQGSVRLANTEVVAVGTVVWAAGVKAHPLIAGAGLPTERGRVVVDSHLRAGPGVYGAGDAAVVDGAVSASNAQFAIRQGRYLGTHLPALMTGGEVPGFDYSTKGELVSLGHRNAVGRVLGVPVSGLAGWFLWRSYYLLQLPTMLRKSRVALDWTLDMVFPPDIAWIPSSDLGPGISRGPG
jgi:NADH dehydrogenase